MSRHIVRRAVVAALVILALLLPGRHAAAVNLPPGGAVALPGSAPIGGALVFEQFRDFEIVDAGGELVFAGTLHDYVVLQPDGTLLFVRRIFDTLVDAPSAIVEVIMDDYTGAFTDVDWDPTGPGQIRPLVATRDGMGAAVTYDFSGNPIHETEESYPFYADTDAQFFSVTGVLTIKLDSGESTSIVVSEPVIDDTAPEAVILSPAPLTCVCNPAFVEGIADDPDGTYDGHRLEYRPINDPTWSLIGSSLTPVPAPGGFLFSWDTTLVPQGYYVLRLTVDNTAGMSTSVVTVVWVDKQFDNLAYDGPLGGSVLGGIVCPHGTINDHCAETYTVEYAPQGGSFQPVDPGMPVYNGPKVNQTFAPWDTNGLPDGAYTVRVTATDSCGHVDVDEKDYIIDNTAPVAIITSPENCDCVDGLVTVIGTASDANLHSWVLQYSGGNQNTWVTIAQGTTNVFNGVLGTWDTTSLPNCPHVLRLVVTDEADIDCNGAVHHQSSFIVAVNVGCDETCEGDLNGDGVVDTADLLIILGAWGICP